MASQANAKTLAGLTLQTMKALQGVREMGANEDLNIQDMEAVLESGLTLANQAMDACSAEKAAKDVQRLNLKATSTALREFVKDSMTLFKLTFGAHWNGRWQVLNLPVGSVKVPGTKAQILQTAQRIHAFLVANPTKEGPAFGVTAVNAAAKIAAVDSAEHAMDAAKTSVRNCIDRCEAAAKVLARNLRVLRERLGVMAADDNRWLSFGYSRPCDPNTPEVPSGVTTTKVGEVLAVSWSPVPRAERYKVYALEKGVDQEAQLMATTSETEAYLSGLKAGASYAITVTAVNKAGESQSDTPMEVAF